MKKTPVILTVRSSSTRLPDKCLMSLGDKSVLEHVVDRLSHFNFEVVVCTTSEKSDDRLVDLFQNIDKVKIFRGSVLNKVERWLFCFRSLGISQAHLLDADDPFFNPWEIRHSISELMKNKTDVVLPSKLSESGYASVGTSITLSALEKLSKFYEKNGIDEIDYIPWKSVLKEIELPYLQLQDTNFASNSPELRLTLDYDDDLEVIKCIYSALGSYSSREEIENYLFTNDNVRLKNLYRNRQFLENQKKQSEKLIRVLKG